MTEPKRDEARSRVTSEGGWQPRRPLITGFPVLLDACVLVNSTVRDFLLSAAEVAFYRPLWSATILAEVRGALLRLGVPESRADYLLREMGRAFEEAEVGDYEQIIGSMPIDSKDRHVMAASIVGKAQMIVTDNQRHFPQASLDPYKIEVISADDFLRDLADLDRDRMREVLSTISSRREMPPKTVAELLDAVERAGCPGFAADMRDYLVTQDPDKFKFLTG